MTNFLSLKTSIASCVLSGRRRSAGCQSILLLVLFTFPFIQSCEFPSQLFTPRAVTVVRGESVEKKLTELEKRVKKYEKIINAKVKAGEQLAEVYEAIGIAFLQKENWQEAIRHLEMAIAEGNGNDMVHKNLAVAYANRGKALLSEQDYEKASYHYRQAIELNPANYEAHYGYGILLFFALGERTKGAELIEKVALAQPAFYPARLALARVYYDLALPNKSLDTYKTLLDELSSQNILADMQSDIIANMTRITEEIASSGAEEATQGEVSE